MQRMTIQLTLVRTIDEQVVARAKVEAPEAGARLWIELRFESQRQKPWDEAYERVLSLLDIA